MLEFDTARLGPEYGLRGDQRTYVVENLIPNLGYSFRVRAINDFGRGQEASKGSGMFDHFGQKQKKTNYLIPSWLSTSIYIGPLSARQASRKHVYIILTPLKPHFYIVKLEFTGVYVIFLISAQKHNE